MTIKKEITYCVEMTAQQKENLVNFLTQSQKSNEVYMGIESIYGSRHCDDIRETLTDLLTALEDL